MAAPARDWLQAAGTDQEAAPAREYQQLEEYAGTYGNFAYGNLTVQLDSSPNEELVMLYGNTGNYSLIPTETEHVFQAQPRTQFASFYDPGRVTFEMSPPGDVIDRLHIPNFEPLSPVVFIRDLTQAEAPPPSLESCEP